MVVTRRSWVRVCGLFLSLSGREASLGGGRSTYKMMQKKRTTVENEKMQPTGAPGQVMPIGNGVRCGGAQLGIWSRSPFRPVRVLERRNRQSHGAQRHQPRRGALWQSRIGQRRLPTLPNGSGMERTKGGVARGSVPSCKVR
ncbi:UNVERIFIED_CONTAM: hypothetical protein FKN15_035577 [Acipenser sinensis]